MDLSVALFNWCAGYFMRVIPQDHFARRRIERQLNHRDFSWFKCSWVLVVCASSLQGQIKKGDKRLVNRPGCAFSVQPKRGDEKLSLKLRSLEKQPGAAPGKKQWHCLFALKTSVFRDF